MKSLFVGGRFDDFGGRESKLAKLIFESAGLNNSNSDFFNGGYFSSLEKMLQSVKMYNSVFWFAEVPNDKPKLSKEIKKINPHCLLVGSKRNSDGKYSFSDLLHRALDYKNNLLVEFSGSERYKARLIDPLGNVFLESENFELLGKALAKRVEELKYYSRAGSEKEGENIGINPDEEFFSLIKGYAEKFHNLVHLSDSPCRFMGNASFRCESGFPSYRNGKFIYVSKRNNDKRFLDSSSFVPVKPELPVRYFGEDKPSVDMPVQLILYNYYEKIKYMLHSHVYVRNAEFVEKIIPCGAVEEAAEIIKLFPCKEKENFAVNLKGHGSIYLASNLGSMKEIDYVPRAIPEIHNYLEEK